MRSRILLYVFLTVVLLGSVAAANSSNENQSALAPADPGDVNEDAIVDVSDVLAIVQDFGKRSGFDTRADRNSDGVINIFDLVLTTKYWNRQYPLRTPGITVFQVPGSSYVNVTGYCPPVATWCQIRRAVGGYPVLVEGATGQLSVLVTNLSENDVPRYEIRYFTANASISPVQEVSLLVRNPASVTVPSTSSNSSSSPWFEEDWTSYADTSALTTTYPPNIGPASPVGGAVTLVTGQSAMPANTTNAVQMEFYDISGSYACGTEPGVGIVLDLPDAATDQPDEIWVEMPIYLDENYTSDHGCGSFSEHKFIFLFDQRGDQGRWNIMMGSQANQLRFYPNSGGGGILIARQPGSDPGSLASPALDIDTELLGQWVTMRFRARLSSSIGADDGLSQMWIDGVMVLDDPGQPTDAGSTYFSRIALGANSNQRPASTVMWRYGPVKVYIEDPGWEDTSAPNITVLSPSGVLSSELTNATLNITTDETAMCKFDATDLSFDSMGTTFSNTNASAHTHVVTGLSNGTYTYYVRCQDSANNTNNVSATISFSIPAASGYTYSWDQFASEAEMNASSTTSFAMWPNQGGYIELLTNLSSTPWGGSNALRSNWGGGPYTTYSDEQLGVNVHLPAEYQLAELWFEIPIRYSDNFSVDSDHKTMFFLTTTHRYEWRAGAFVNRMALEYDNSLLGTAFDGGSELDLTTASDVWDGNWHTLRVHVRTGASGQMQSWWDGKYHINETASFASENITTIALFRNGDPSVASTIDVGDIIIYDEDPGW